MSGSNRLPRWGTPRALAAVLGLVLCALPGCCTLPEPIRGGPHHVLLIPGILGEQRHIRIPRDVIAAAYPNATTQIWDWTCIDRPWDQRILSPIGVDNLTNYERNQRRATILAIALDDWRRQANPGDKLQIVAVSGGVGLTCFALERTSPEFRADRIVFISGAISRDYDLAPILAHTRRGLYAYHSHRDWLVLGRGTRKYGTMDRRCADAVGRIGLPPREGIWQLAWRREFRQYGNRGGHGGGLARKFIAAYVVPMLDDDPVNDPPEWTPAGHAP